MYGIYQACVFLLIKKKSCIIIILINKVTLVDDFFKKADNEIFDSYI